MRVKIVYLPTGPTPLWTRQVMLGLILTVIQEADYNKYLSLAGLTADVRSRLKDKMYPVAVSEILQVVTDKAAVEWFKASDSDTILFLKDCCRQAF